LDNVRVTITPATAADLRDVRDLLREYEQWVGMDLTFQQFDAEVAALPGAYAPPDGALLIARIDGEPAGMVALRLLTPSRAEMKRLFVRSSSRGLGLGRLLAERIIAEARARAYRDIVLDTLPPMAGAQRLYEALGFRDIAAYYPSAIAGTRYMAMRL